MKYVLTSVIYFPRHSPPASSQKFSASLCLQICHFGHLYTDKGISHIRNINRKTKVYGIYYIIRNFTLSFNKMEINEKIFINGKCMIIEK